MSVEFRPQIRQWLLAFSQKNTEERLVTLLAGGICIAGALLRVYFFLVNRSLWLDEASLANNIIGRSFTGLLQPLAHTQAAPLAFLMLEKVASNIFGPKDWALRLVPLASGLASIPLMYYVAGRFMARWSMLLALALFAFSVQLIYFSSEAKQYSTDVVWTLLVLWAGCKCLDQEAGSRGFLILAIAGSIAIWFSHPSLFTLGGVGAALGIRFLLRRDWRRLAWLALAAGLSAASLATVYFISLRFTVSNARLLQFWHSSFAPLPPWRNWAWYGNSLNAMLADPAMLPAGIITVAMLAVGFLSLARRRLELALMLLFPLLLTLIASGFELYPFQWRLLLFLVPLLWLMLSEAIGQIHDQARRLNGAASWLLLAAGASYFLYAPIYAAYRNVQRPPMREDIKPVMAYLRDQRQSGDVIYVYYGAEPAFTFYAPAYGIQSGDYIIGQASRNSPQGYLRQVDSLTGNRRVWFLFTHNHTSSSVDEMAFFLAYLDKIGRMRGRRLVQGAYLYLYDLHAVYGPPQGNMPLHPKPVLISRSTE